MSNLFYHLLDGQCKRIKIFFRQQERKDWEIGRVFITSSAFMTRNVPLSF